MTANDLRTTPQSVESEQSVLGALLLDNDAVDRINDLRTEHFYRGDHRAIYAEIVNMISSGIPADVMTVYERLTAKGKSDDTGGLAYLNALAQNTPGSANIARYAQIVRDRSQKRGLLVVASEIQDSVVTTPDEAVVLIDRAQEKLERLAEARVKSEPILAAERIGEYLSKLEDRIEGKGAPVPTGLRDLDEKLGGGMNAGDLVIVAGRPAMGKTAFAFGVANHVALEAPALLLEMEMTIDQLQQRNVSMQGRVSMRRLRDPNLLTNEDWDRITVATKRIIDLKLYLDDQSGLTMLEVRSKARAIKRKYGLSLLVVDYIGLMAMGSEERHDLRIGAITKGLKSLAKELEIPVIALSQLSRKCEERTDKRPLMSDLKDSGDIEADADTILFLYRDEVYHPDSMDRGIAEIIIAKQRQGETGRVAASYIGDYTRFEDLAPGHAFGQSEKSSRSNKRGFE
jgi:replicative DNA helicase